MTFDYSKAQQLLADARRETGLTTRFVGMRIGVSPAAISSFERDKRPTKNNFLKLKALYETHLSDQIEFHEKEIKRLRIVKAGLGIVDYSNYKNET